MQNVLNKGFELSFYFSILLKTGVLMESISFERIPQKSIHSLIRKQKNLHSLKPSYSVWENLEGLYEHEEIFYSKHQIDKVWESYIKSSPVDVWKGKLVSFGLMYSKDIDKLTYIGDIFTGAKSGQVYFINLKLLGGLYNLAVSHQIVNVNKEKKHLEISYIEGGKSIGIQRISFHQTNENGTKIIHKSYYKSKSYLRDKLLYPYFHTKVLKEYHNNMIKHISDQSK